MKSFGLNVALDSLLPFIYTGAKGPFVVVVADDPSCHSSAQSEENVRGLSLLAHIPTLEPSDPQECKDFVKLGFQISEKFKIPVMIRITTRVAHQRAVVKLRKLVPHRARSGAGFIKDPKRFVTMPPRVLEMKKELLEKIEKIREFSEKSEINTIQNPKSKIQNTKIGIITSGVSYLYVMEALNELNLNLPVLKLGFFYPLPEEKIKKFIKDLKKVLIVEELEPYLEKEVERLAKNVNCKLKIIGKELLPEVGELKPEQVILAIAKVTKQPYRESQTLFGPAKLQITNLKQILNSKIQTPKRFPQFCPGCPYWLVISAIKKAVNLKKVIFGGDIGCYMLFGFSPFNIQDYLSCMGSSIGIAHGIKKVFQQSSGQACKQKLIAFIGDSTFFHAGIPALINTVFNQSNPLIIILDNLTTAMTGYQSHPGKVLKIENIVKACGVKNLKIIDPINQKEFIAGVKDFLKKKRVSVIIARHPCIFVK